MHYKKLSKEDVASPLYISFVIVDRELSRRKKIGIRIEKI